VLEADDGDGRIDLRGVTGPIYDDGTTVVRGRLSGLLIPGTCDGGPFDGGSTTSSTTLPAASTTSTLPGATSTSTTSSTTTSTTTTLPPSGLVPADFRFYVQIRRAPQAVVNVNVPSRSSDPPLTVEIAVAALPAFRPGDRVSYTELAALDADTRGRLRAAVVAHLESHADDYPGLLELVELRWARRE
jgi:hypothetical protein